MGPKLARKWIAQTKQIYIMVFLDTFLVSVGFGFAPSSSSVLKDFSTLTSLLGCKQRLAIKIFQGFYPDVHFLPSLTHCCFKLISNLMWTRKGWVSIALIVTCVACGATFKLKQLLPMRRKNGEGGSRNEPTRGHVICGTVEQPIGSGIAFNYLDVLKIKMSTSPLIRSSQHFHWIWLIFPNIWVSIDLKIWIPK